MKMFHYKAMKPDGERIQGVVEAKNEKQAIDILRNKSFLIIKLEDQERKIGYQLGMKLSRVSSEDLIQFTRSFASMIDSGLPMVSALQLIQHRSKPAMAKIISDITTSVEGGQSLYKALALHSDIFPPLYLALVKAGETAGVLGEVLTRLSESMETQRDFMGKVKSAMLYPIVVMVAMFAVGLIMIFFVLPKMSDLYSSFDTTLPTSTALLLNGSVFIREQWYLILIIIVAVVGGIIYWLRSPHGKEQFDELILKAPYIGELQNKVISTTIIDTLSLLIKAGVSIVESLQVIQKISSNTVYQKGIANAAANVEKGLTLTASFNQEHFFPEEIIQMMSVGEETGKLDEMLTKIAKQFEKDSLLALKSLTSAIEPAMIIILGIGVGFMVMSIIMPIYNLTSQFGS